MNDIWKQYINKTPKEILTSEKFYMVSFKSDGEGIKAFPAKYFELFDELKEWLR